ncbi:MAG: hypothetical protein WA434_18905 [Candidatus Acidiferrales bacterium]
MRNAAFTLLMVLVPAMACAQTQAAGQSNPSEHPQQNPATQGNSTSAPPSDSGATSGAGQSSDQNTKQDQSQPQQTKRMMYVVPNFAAVSANTELPPLSARGKFVLAWHDSFDYSSFVWTGIVATQSYGLDSDPELGSGIAGYGRYYWRAFVDGTSGTYFTEAIVPAMTHEDPRYYTMGHGGFFRRIGYALSRSVLTKTDSGGTSFNWSEVGGNGLEAALSNAYYPPQERGISQTATNWATQMESAALNNIAKEFWPDFRSKVLRRK